MFAHLSPNGNAHSLDLSCDQHDPGVSLHEDEGSGELAQVEAFTTLRHFGVTHLGREFTS